MKEIIPLNLEIQNLILPEDLTEVSNIELMGKIIIEEDHKILG
jgi:hypothetical protein